MEIHTSYAGSTPAHFHVTAMLEVRFYAYAHPPRSHTLQNLRVDWGALKQSLLVTSPLSLRRDLFITPDIKDFFSVLTLNFAFLPRKLMVSHSQGFCSLCPPFVVFCRNFCS